MKRGLLLLAAGFLMLVVSVGWWLAGRPAVESGDAAAIEQSLTSTSAAPVASTPSSTTPVVPPEQPAAVDTQPTTSFPQFTVGRQSQGNDRIPVTLEIPAIEVDAPIVLVGVESDGEMEVPEDVTDVGWYKHGPGPGEPGSAVLAAHVDLASQGPGVFFDLRTVGPGDVIYVGFDDGTTEAYRAEARTIYDKTELPIDTIFSRGGPPVLTLITCGGGFNRSLQSYDSNVVVYAVPFGQNSMIN